MPPDAVRRELLELAGVCGVGYGLAERGGRLTARNAWRVYVERKLPRRMVPPGALVPRTVAGIPTDVIERRPTARTSAAGASIANARGVPGTIGFLSRAREDDRPVAVSNHHVLFGAGGAAGEPVWMVTSGGFERLGAVVRGTLGTVAGHYVDCAACSVEHPKRWRRALVRIGTPPIPGARVRKRGGATGWTEGVVVDVAYPDIALIEGRVHHAPGQILVRGCSGRFSEQGDSGAALQDATGAVVGLLWGANGRADSVACHAGPVVGALGLRAARARRSGWRSAA